MALDTRNEEDSKNMLKRTELTLAMKSLELIGLIIGG